MDEAKERDYKAEYKKFQSSTKSKKYRAELNKYNRKKGTYGNGDGKDASHKGGKIVGFESQSKNRGRAEKSRLKQESVNEAGTKSIDGEELLNFLMKRFKYSKKKAIDVMKKNNMDLSFLKNESVNEGFTSSQLGKLRNQMKDINRVNPSSPIYKKLTKLLDVLSISELQQIAKADIKFLSLLAKNRLVRKGIKDSVEEGFGGELTGKDKEKFEKARKENAEQLGYKVTGVSDIKESVNEAENKIADIRKILKTKKGKRIDSIFMDVETAEKVIKLLKVVLKKNLQDKKYRT
jgi:hypothetical protein